LRHDIVQRPRIGPPAGPDATRPDRTLERVRSNTTANHRELVDLDSSQRPVARFLQISDLHLGAPLGWLPPEAREARRRDQRYALEAAVRAAIERRADAMLIPGDLFDRERVDAETMAFALHAFDAPGCPPVFITPGNHDPWSEASPCWSPRLLQARGWSWPEHVHVFTSPGWTAWPLADTDVRIWGRAYATGTPAGERPLAAPPAVEGDPRLVHVALFHGSREGACPAWQDLTGPFSDADVLESPFTYLAAGHYHVPSQVLDRGPAGDTTRLAYAGSGVALNLSETGPHGALDVCVERTPAGTRTTVAQVPLDPRKVYALDLDVSGASSADEIDRRVRAVLEAAGASARDFASVRLSGRLVNGVRFGGPGPELAGCVFHLRLDLGRLRPGYDLEAYRQGDPVTTEHRYARSMLDQIDAASDPATRALLERALYYGLDAIVHGEVVPAYEDIAS